MNKVIIKLLSRYKKKVDSFDKEYGFLLKYKIVDINSYSRVKSYFFLRHHKSE